MAGYDHPSTAIGCHRARGAGLMSADIDVERARRDTPGTANVAHRNNAGGYEAASAPAPSVRAHLRRHRPAPRLYPDLRNLDWAAASSSEGVRACRSEK